MRVVGDEEAGDFLEPLGHHKPILKRIFLEETVTLVMRLRWFVLVKRAEAVIQIQKAQDDGSSNISGDVAWMVLDPRVHEY